jgi:hypothetical protein
LSVQPWNANSGTLVLPTITAPAETRRSTVTSLRSAGARPSIVREPHIVTIPAASVVSLTSSGKPASGPCAPPSSSARASSSAASPRTTVTAFTIGL